jgi:hypothetical protein
MIATEKFCGLQVGIRVSLAHEAITDHADADFFHVSSTCLKL